jgi:sugar lactone lactonase YvrE
MRITLLSSLFAILLAFAPHAFAITNGQAATLVIGESSLTSFNPTVTQSGIVAPTALAFDSHGNLWVADQGSNRVLEYKAPLSNHEAASIVLGQSSFTSRDYTTSATTLNVPDGIAFDSSGNLWVADATNNRVVEYTAPFSNGEAASVAIGQKDFTSNGMNTTATTLNQPEAVAFDSSGHLWVADALNSRVLEYTAPFSTGEAATLVIGEKDFVSANDEVSKAGMSTPSGIAFDSSGNMWVVDGIRVLEYHAPFTTHEAASLVIGQNTFTNSSTVTDATGLDLPNSVAFDSSGNLWVSDYGNSRVLEYAAPLSTGEAATGVLGQLNFTGGLNAPALRPTASSLNHPWGIAFDSSGNLWVSDYAGGRVLGYGAVSAGSSSASTTSASTTSSTVAASTTSSVGATGTTSTTVAPTTSAATTSSSTSSGGGVPAFPYQAAIATVFTVLLAATYLLVRRRMTLGNNPAQGPAGV